MFNSMESFHITNAGHDDFEAVYNLYASGKVRYFGELKRKEPSAEIFFQNYISHRFVVHISENNPIIIGYAEVTNSPYIPALPSDCWTHWLFHHYCPKLQLNNGNTIFLNTFIFNIDYKKELMNDVLSEIFHRESKVRYVVVAQCPEYGFRDEKSTPDYTCLDSFSTVYYPFCFSAISCPNTQKVHIIHRDTIISKMRYRRALPEDNDDIVELVHKDRPDIKEQLGDFYIAEELLSEVSNSMLIVTEIAHTTAGFIWLNDSVNLETLVENYDLELFDNLLRFNPNGKFKEKIFFITAARRVPINKLFTTEDIDAILESQKKSDESDDESLSTFSTEDSYGVVPEKNPLKLREEIFGSLEALMETLQTYDYYIQLRRKRYGVFYNVPEDQKTAAFDAQSNVFVIQMFGIMEHYDLRRLSRYLYTSFAAYPDRDYCLMSVSVTQSMTMALFEMLNYLIPVNPRPGCKVDEHLYLTHRSAIYGDITLYPVRAKDVAEIKHLLTEDTDKPAISTARRTQQTKMSTVASRMSLAIFSALPSEVALETKKQYQAEYDTMVLTNILDDIFNNPSSEYRCLTIKCGDSTRPEDDSVIVGFVAIRPFYSSSQLKKHFLLTNLNEAPTRNEAEILLLKLHPFFHFQADLIFRELARQSDCWHFYSFRHTLHPALSNDLVTYMQPLEPRRIKKVWFCNKMGDKLCQCPSHDASTYEEASKEKENIYPVNFYCDNYEAFQHNLCPSAYFGNTMNIVIMGFSDICKAFLRLMLFSWHGVNKNVIAHCNCLPHLGITVICQPGVMEAEHENQFRCGICEDDNSCWVNYRNCDAFIRDVTERMDIRTWVKFVSGKVRSIDTENHSIKMESECEIYYETLLLMCDTSFGIPTGLMPMEANPPNYIQINNRFDKLCFYHRLRIFNQKMPESYKKSFVIYGNHISAFEFINFLVLHGVQSSEISLVMPYKVASQQMGLMLNDSSIDTRIEEILKEMAEDMGVQLYDQMNLVKINISDSNDLIENVYFKQYLVGTELTLNCDFFISYWENYMSEHDMEVFENAGMDLVGPLLRVSENYETNRRYVYAIGNHIKQRREPNHQYRFVNPQEAAEKIINILDLYNIIEDADAEKYSRPYYFQAQLPLKHRFCKLSCPKRYLANHLDNEYGFPLTTYWDGDFTRVRLNEHGMVEEIVLVTKKAKDYDFLKFFCGRHELMLNNLKSRWYLKDIESFVLFFQEPWVELLMNDRFEELQMLNRLLILPTAHEVMKLNLDREARQKIMRSYCSDLGVTSQLEYAFLEFVRENREDFSEDIALPEDFPTAQTTKDF